jgi:predicted nucleic acid-binding protein
MPSSRSGGESVSAKKRRLLDSSALIAYFNHDRGFDHVRNLLNAARQRRENLLLHEINLGETYYIVAKKVSLAAAEKVLKKLETLPVDVMETSRGEVLEAARLKARVPLSYADAFAAVRARREGATLVTSDSEFQHVADQIDIEWF